VSDELPVPERVLCDLLYRHWCMTVEGKPPDERFIAYRPVSWRGEGDPFERITAPTRTELLRLLAYRHLSISRSTPASTSATALTAAHSPTPANARTRVSTTEEGRPPMSREPDPDRRLTPAEEAAHRRKDELVRQRIGEEQRREQADHNPENQ
jgi:hypothetical protein